MRLLLTSNGLVNDAIRQAFLDLTFKPVEELRVAFIPSAKNKNSSSTAYFSRVFANLTKLGVVKTDIVDIDGMAYEELLSRLKLADVIYVGGGNTYYLLNCFKKCGLYGEMSDLLKTRMYVGDSAGAIIVTPSIDIAEIDNGDENIVNLKDTSGLSLVDFEVSPHTPEDVSIDANSRYAATVERVLYAFDNETAIKYLDGSIDFVGNGEYQVFNKTS